MVSPVRNTCHPWKQLYVSLAKTGASRTHVPFICEGDELFAESTTNGMLEARNSRAARAISLTPQDWPMPLRAYREGRSVSEMPALSPGSLLRGLHHRFLHTVFSCPIQADLVAIGIVEIGMPPTPGHHAWQLGDVEPLLLKIA